LLKVNTPRPTAAVLSTAWPIILLVVVVSFLFATLFPTIGTLLWFTAPPAVVIAVAIAALRARSIRLTVTDEVVRVSNGKTGYACDRAQVQSALLVSKMRRRALAPRTTDLFLLDGAGSSVMLLSGRLWPAALLEQVIALISPGDVQRLPGPENLTSLQTRFPRILREPGSGNTRSGNNNQTRR
jgi:hypothetical protein